MARKDPWLERFPQIALAIGTAILAVDILVGWLTGAFDRDSLSGTISAVVLNLTLALIAAVATVAALFYWRKLHDFKASFIDWATRLLQAEQPEGPPIIPDVTDPGYPPLSNLQLADLYADARAIGERAYSDAKLCGIAIVSVASERPSIRVRFDFYSEHAGKAAEVDWDNYRGFGDALAGDLELLANPKGWDEVPWEACPQWEKFYRLAYEKVQPLRDPPLVIVSSSFDDDCCPWFFHFPHNPNHPCYALSTDGQLIEKKSVYSLKIAVFDTLGPALRPKTTLGPKVRTTDVSGSRPGATPPPRG